MVYDVTNKKKNNKTYCIDHRHRILRVYWTLVILKVFRFTRIQRYLSSVSSHDIFMYDIHIRRKKRIQRCFLYNQLSGVRTKNPIEAAPLPFFFFSELSLYTTATLFVGWLVCLFFTHVCLYSIHIVYIRIGTGEKKQCEWSYWMRIFNLQYSIAIHF